jgi:ribosomal silencing factor RsfS
MGRLVVHLFFNESREFYDLEGLWACGSEFDEKLMEFKEEKLAI